MIVVVMGVSGCGKSTIGAGVAAARGWPFEDGDALHPAANVAKMAAGHPLTDEDRAGWLAAVRAWMDGWIAAGVDGVIACSALRRAYRDVLRDGPGEVRFVFLDVDVEVLRARLAERVGHFMPAALLDSQLATLERPVEPEQAITIPIGADTTSEDVVAAILRRL